LAGLLVLLAAGTLAAQTRVYESRDAAGPVFSDQPSPDAKPVEVPPTNVIESQRPPPVPTAAPASAYKRLEIVDPPNEGTIHSNTGAFAIQWRVEPALNADSGHAVLVRIDGNVLDTRYSATPIDVTEGDWSRAATSDDVQHSLQIAVVDGSGRVLIESSPTTFYMHRASVLLRSRK
jgi:hypothetical protein